MTFPSDKTVSSIAFEVVGPSIDFDGNYMLVGSARPHKNLLLCGMKTKHAVLGDWVECLSDDS